jgi:Tfp pilus assembly protein PilF
VRRRADRALESPGLAAYLLIFIFIGPGPGAFVPSQDQVRDAQRLRDSGQFAAALEALDARLREAPDDADAARMRAQTLYWLKDVGRAREAYAGALARHPQDQRIRIEYARMLAEIGERHAARDLLEPLVRAPHGSAEAQALLGTVLYWDGDLTGAKQLFVEALRKDPAQRDAARQLREIQVLAASWVKVAPAIWHDDQPLDRGGAILEAGWFATPLLSLAVRASPQHYSTDIGRTFWNSEVELSHFAPSAHLTTHLAAGVIRRPGEQQHVDWTMRAAVGFRTNGGFTVEGRVAREAYLHTLASLETPLMTTTAAGVLNWSRGPGWLGEAAVQRQTFPDENAITSAYGWLLAPVVHGANGQLQAGYAIAAADAREDRFTLANPQQPFHPSDPRFDFTGIYDPYFTPARVLTHSAIAAVTLGKSTGPVLRAGGSYGFHAREDATTFAVLDNSIVPTIGRTAFTPWTARASVEIPASSSLAFIARAESGRTSYYQWTAASIEMVYHFLPQSPVSPQRQ